MILMPTFGTFGNSVHALAGTEKRNEALKMHICNTPVHKYSHSKHIFSCSETNCVSAATDERNKLLQQVAGSVSFSDKFTEESPDVDCDLTHTHGCSGEGGVSQRQWRPPFKNLHSHAYVRQDS